MLKYARWTCVLMLSAVVLSAQVNIPVPVVQTTGMVGIADAQTAQLNLLNPGVEAPATGVICTAAVSFVDAAGTVLKTATVTAAPGTSTSFILRSDVDLQLVAGDRREIRRYHLDSGRSASDGARRIDCSRLSSDPDAGNSRYRQRADTCGPGARENGAFRGSGKSVNPSSRSFADQSFVPIPDGHGSEA